MEMESNNDTIKTKDGTQIYLRTGATGQPVVFSHGWPLNADCLGKPDGTLGIKTAIVHCP